MPRFPVSLRIRPEVRTQESAANATGICESNTARPMLLTRMARTVFGCMSGAASRRRNEAMHAQFDPVPASPARGESATPVRSNPATPARSEAASSVGSDSPVTPESRLSPAQALATQTADSVGARVMGELQDLLSLGIRFRGVSDSTALLRQEDVQTLEQLRLEHPSAQGDSIERLYNLLNTTRDRIMEQPEGQSRTIVHTGIVDTLNDLAGMTSSIPEGAVLNMAGSSITSPPTRPQVSAFPVNYTDIQTTQDKADFADKQCLITLQDTDEIEDPVVVAGQLYSFAGLKQWVDHGNAERGGDRDTLPNRQAITEATAMIRLVDQSSVATPEQGAAGQ